MLMRGMLNILVFLFGSNDDMVTVITNAITHN